MVQSGRHRVWGRHVRRDGSWLVLLLGSSLVAGDAIRVAPDEEGRPAVEVQVQRFPERLDALEVEELSEHLRLRGIQPLGRIFFVFVDPAGARRPVEHYLRTPPEVVEAAGATWLGARVRSGRVSPTAPSPGALRGRRIGLSPGHGYNWYASEG